MSFIYADSRLTQALLFTYNAYLYTQLMPPAVLAYIDADLGPDPNYIWITIR